ncbi:MAG: hypothetical protein OEZ01_10740, partial [Candidatus Heimdallarchaeota archaeon]|nr:hypothetical protein [Candidatus Heimdallarchaeota archaeon]
MKQRLISKIFIFSILIISLFYVVNYVDILQSDEELPLTNPIDTNSNLPDITDGSSHTGISTQASNDSNLPTFLLQSSIEFLVFNSTISSYYFRITSNAYHSSIATGFYVNSTSAVDITMNFNIYSLNTDFTSFHINTSDEVGVGEAEIFIYQPYLNPNLFNQEIGVNITNKAASGNATLNFVMTAQDYVVRQPVGVTRTHNMKNLSLKTFNIINLNYSSGANIELFVNNFGYASKYDTYSFDFAIYGSPGGWSSMTLRRNNFNWWNYTDVFDVNIGSVNKTTMNFLTLVVFARDYDVNHYLKIGTNITLSDVNGMSYQQILPITQSIQLNASSNNLFAFEISSKVVGLSIFCDVDINQKISFDSHATDLIGSGLQHAYNVSYYVFQDYGNQVNANPVGYHWYFINVTSSQAGNLSLTFTTKLTPNYSAQNANYQVAASLDAPGSSYMDFFVFSIVPSKSIIFVTPTPGLDVKLILFNSTGHETNMLVADQYGMGSVESLGELRTDSQELYIVVIIAVSGSGSVTLKIVRNADLLNPSIYSASFNSYNQDYSTPFVLTISAYDVSGLYNTTLYYRANGTSDPWQVLAGSSSNQYYIGYGIWEVKVSVFDVVFKQTTFPTTFIINSTDSIAPILGLVEVEFIPDTLSEIRINAFDLGSGISQVLVYYNISNIQANVTANYNLDRYVATLPTFGENQTIFYYIEITDLVGNSLTSDVFIHFIGEV